MAQYNLKNPAVKRLMKEAAELQSPTEEYYAQPLEDNLFEWHFTLRGPPNTEFENGVYHGRITLPPDYPMKPPSIILLTPNGRFETNKKICLSISGHHPETWRPSWSIRTALLAIIGFMPTHGNGAIGSLDYTPEERKHLALKSQSWKCPDCGCIRNVLKVEDASKESSEEPDALSEKRNEVDDASPEELGTRASDSNASTPLSESVVGEGHGSNLKPTQTHSSENSNLSCPETESVPHLRRKTTPREDKAEAPSPVLIERRNGYDFCSLVFMWVIAAVLVILIARRLFYQ